MFKLIRLTWVPVVLVLSACDVQVRDETPAEYPANHDIGMYEIKATVTRDALVTPGSVFVFALGNDQKIPLSQDGSEWRGLYSVRCQSSFPVQFLAEWHRAALDVKKKIVPPQPRQIKLKEPPLTFAASFDASGKMPKGGWVGSVQYRFVTVPSAQISAAHIEPSSDAPADVAAAKAISVLTPLPLLAPCGDRAEIRLAATSPHAHGTLSIDTDHPSVPHWQTKVEFSPK
ncbi:MAG TPA: hypothetical protein VGD47_08445 [Steroidobacteraceae bacterium]